MTSTIATTNKNMLTAIYIYEPSTITVRPPDSGDKSSQLYRYNQAAQPAVGTHKLEPGIYMIVSKCALVISTGGVEVHTVTNDKDDPPRPKVTALALEPGATADSVAKFFSVALGL
jgi:hypothetical protein